LAKRCGGLKTTRLRAHHKGKRTLLTWLAGKLRCLHPRWAIQYTSIDHAQTLTDHRVLASVGSVGDAYDNALAESFVDSFKTELITDRVWRSRRQLELVVVKYIGWDNATRLHESLGDIPPLEHEKLHRARTDYARWSDRVTQLTGSPSKPVRLNPRGRSWRRIPGRWPDASVIYFVSSSRSRCEARSPYGGEHPRKWGLARIGPRVAQRQPS
jgi:hypothetical protein